MDYPQAIQNMTDGKAAKPSSWGGFVERVDLPPEHSTATAYAIDSLVTRSNKIYISKQAVSAGAWNAAQWTEVCAAVPEFSPSASYAVGDKVWYESSAYQCHTATTGAFDSSKWTRLSGRNHAIVFNERQDTDSADSHTRYAIGVTFGTSGRTVSTGGFSTALKMDTELFRAMTYDSSWTVGEAEDYRKVLTGGGRW